MTIEDKNEGKTKLNEPSKGGEDLHTILVLMRWKMRRFSANRNTNLGGKK